MGSGRLKRTNAPEEYVYRRAGRTHLWAYRAVADVVASMIQRAGSLYLGARQSPGAVALHGRDVAYSMPAAAGGRWMVRRLSHGGVFAPLTRGLFLRAAGNRPLNELRVSGELLRRGIPTPRVLAAAVYDSGPFYRGEVAREFVEARGDLAGCLFSGRTEGDQARILALRAAGNLIGRMHRAGLVHPDLNLRNILIVPMDESGRVDAWILDLEKCRMETSLSRSAREAMIDRLRRSAARFEISSGKTLTVSEWSAFTEAYRQEANV